DTLHTGARHPLAGGDPALGKLFTDGDGERVVDVPAAGCLGRLADDTFQAIDDRFPDGAEAQRRRRSNRRSLRHECLAYLTSATFSATMRHDAPSRTRVNSLRNELVPNFWTNRTMRRSSPAGSTRRPSICGSGVGPVATCSRRCSSQAALPAESVGAVKLEE